MFHWVRRAHIGAEGTDAERWPAYARKCAPRRVEKKLRHLDGETLNRFTLHPTTVHHVSANKSHHYRLARALHVGHECRSEQSDLAQFLGALG